MTGTTPGLVCAHHHLYSALARGMPAPPTLPTSFGSILEQVWWRLDCALDLEMLEWSAKLGALEALASGTTAIVDHHESPNAIEGSLDVIAAACEEVGVRVVCSYGATDRHGGTAPVPVTPQPSADLRPARMTDAARRGLAECERFVRAGGRAMVGLHAAFTCAEETLEAAADLAVRLGVGVHVHVAEGPGDADAGARLAPMAREDWLLVHCVHLRGELPGTIAHNPRSNMNNAVGYAAPAGRSNRVVLGTDGIGADMLDEFRVAYVRQRESDVTASPDVAWGWLENGWALVPEARDRDEVVWSYDPMEPWHLAFTTGVRPERVSVGGEVVWSAGRPTRVDEAEVRARAAEQASRLFARL
jgi:cytosine/adenosine deaminase-related metal-dependent hydrolase